MQQTPPRTTGRTNWWQRGARAALLLSTLGFCSCSSLGWRPAAEQAGTRGVQLIPDTPQTVVPQVADTEQGGIRQIAWETAQPVQLASASASVIHADVDADTPRQTVPLHLINHETSQEELQDLWSERYPDEYIFDGGDRGLPFHYENGNRAGFESEDTVAEYRDHTGDHHVKPTTRTAIYAPRFAAVRTVTLPHEGAISHGLASNHKFLPSTNVQARAVTTFHNEYLTAGGMRMRSRPSGLGSETQTHGLGQTTVAARNDKLLNVFENIQFLKSGRIDNTQSAILVNLVEGAATWTKVDGLQIIASDAGGNELKATFKPMEITGLEDGRKTVGDLRIVKLADLKTAEPGDVVTFSIRYDNLGDFELKNIRIVDNLTSRLEFLEGSAQSDRVGRVDVYDNGEGSLIVEFQLQDDLPGHQGGVLTFQARVR